MPAPEARSRPDLRIAHVTMCPWAARPQFEIIPEWTRRRRVAGMLGAGFAQSTVDRGLELGADVISVDAGSTDSGPHYQRPGGAPMRA